MTGNYLANLVLLFGSLCPMLAVANGSPQYLDFVQEQVYKLRKEFKAPGISLTIFEVKKNKLVTYSSGLETKDPAMLITDETLFNFSSIVKQFVVVTVLQMQQEGKLQIDQTLGEVVKKYGGSSFITFDPLWHNVSLRQLLNMTSGICSYWENPQYQDYLVSNNSIQPYHNQEDLIHLARHCNNTFYPGSKWHYSDTNYLILGRIIELISKRTFQQEMHHRFKSIKYLKSTYFSQLLDQRERDLSRLALGYDSKGKKIKKQILLGDSSRFVLSTTRDLAHWIYHLFHSSLLTKQSLNNLKKVVSKETGKPVTTKSASGYSFALDRVSVKGCGSIWYYPGRSPGITTLVAWIPKVNVSVALAVNTDVNYDQFLDRVQGFIRWNICLNGMNKRGNFI
jgi:D-alanyl-D-alanine carboxypeptidase